MKTIIKLCTLSLSAAMFLTSCLPSENPLSAPEDSKPDPKLIGEWVNEEGETMTFVAEEGPWMKMSSGDMKDLRVFPTVLGKAWFLNHELTKDDKTTGYFISRYEIGEDDTLTFWDVDDDLIDEAIRSGEIKGDDQRVTDTTENLVRFIEKHGAEKVFSEKGEPFQRKK